MKNIQFVVCAVLLLSVSALTAQTVSGVINEYYEVTGFDKCNNALTLTATPIGLAPGDHVMIIQMRGVDANPDNTPSYGSIVEYARSGSYELNTVQAIDFNVVTLNEVFISLFNFYGKVQLVKIPYFTDVTVAGTVTGSQWNGTTGGVIALYATGTVTMNADIDASGIGFNGAPLDANDACVGGAGPGYDAYVEVIAENRAGIKGEGVSENGDGKGARGATANGGGGGNDRQTGGGGGSNSTFGGSGGQQLNPPFGLCGGSYPGIGGWQLFYDNAFNRVWMGGGGGGGSSNLGLGTGGGNGGGIVLIIADQIIGNNYTIRANGESVTTLASDDGAGGGGGGGSVLLSINGVSTSLNVEVKGGDGGDVDNSLDGINCVGPGGGGSGGILWYSPATIPGPINLDASGGSSGVTVGEAVGSPCYNSSNFATDGDDGISLNGLVVPMATEPYTELTIDMVPDDAVVCQGNSLTMEAIATGTGSLAYHWNDELLTVTPVLTTIPLNDYVYNVTVTDDLNCSLIGFVNVDVVDTVAITAFPDTTLIIGSSVVLNTSMDDESEYTFSWTPDYNISDITAANPTVFPYETTTYCVTATHPTGCNSTDCITIMVAAEVAFPNAFTPNGDGVNDLFRVPPVANLCEEINYFKVFNRWGQIVYDYFETADSVGWDGNDTNGTSQEVGTYMYVVKMVCDGLPETYSGTVHLLR